MRNTLSKAKGFVDEFKQFAIKGNAIQLAVAVVIGTAFTGIVNSLVGDILTPLLGLLTGNTDFKELKLVLWNPVSAGATPALVLHYGAFLQSVFNFLIIALAMFLIIKLSSAAVRRFAEEEKEALPEVPSAEEKLLTEIRDLLREKRP